MTRMIWAIMVGLFASVVPAQAQPVPISKFPLVGPGPGTEAGQVYLTKAPRELLVRIEVSGLTPGWHAVHFHSVADCSDAGFKMSGGHVHDMAGGASVHGLLNPGETDLGDLPNIYAAADGRANAEIFAPNLSLGAAAGRLNLLDSDGSALVVHASADDHSSQPIGGAGARVACAAIRQ